MNQGYKEFSVRRILVPLDAAEHSQAALETAAEIAALQDAELEGLYVEDINLLQLCELPFAREVSMFGSVVRQLSRPDVERQLRIMARRVYRALAAAAERHKVRWKFRVARGGVPAEILAAAENADLTILGKAGWSRLLQPKMGSTVRTVVARGRGLTLIMQQGVRFEARASVVFTGSALAEKAVSIAASLGKVKGLDLLVLLLGRDPKDNERLRQLAGEIVSHQGVQASFQGIRENTSEALVRAVHSAAPGPVFIPCDAPGFQGDALQGLINRLNTPVFLVRPSPDEEPAPAAR